MKRTDIPVLSESIDCGECNHRLRSIFCELHNDEIERLNNTKKLIAFSKGQRIYQEDSYPRYLYCVNSGKIKITQMRSDGKEQILSLATAGDVLGYRAILCGDNYSTTATAIEDSLLCALPVQLFLTLVKENPNVASKIIHLFSNEIKDAEKKIINISHRPVMERVAQSILLLIQSYGYEEDNCTIQISIKRDELASIAGTTRETATRILFKLRQKDVIGLSGKKIRILKHAELLKYANLNK